MITGRQLLILMTRNESHNNRMQPDFGELALPSAADAKRYVLVLNLLIVSIVLPFANEWHSKDLEGDEIKSQGDSILRS